MQLFPYVRWRGFITLRRPDNTQRRRAMPSALSSRKFRRRPPSAAQAAWLARGLDQPGGKLPLFDDDGGPVRRQTVEACLNAGWAERWFRNPLKPDWLVCRLTDAGRAVLTAASAKTTAATGRLALSPATEPD